jgi:Rrf2 family protein
MHISARADYAVRAASELAAAQPAGDPVKGEHLSRAQGIPHKFLENILSDLRHAGLVRTRRGSEGGYSLTRPGAEISVAEVLRAIEGPLATVQGTRPEELHYEGAAASLPEVWVALRANLRGVLESVSLADLAAGDLPDPVRVLIADEDAWQAH